MKRIDAVTMYNVLVRIQDKNKISDSNVRVALLQNLLNTRKIADENDEYLKKVREQYKSEESEIISRSIAELIQKHASAATTEEKASIEEQIKREHKRLDAYFAPFQKEWEQIVRDREQEDVTVKLSKVSLSSLDAATADLQLPMAAFAALEPMLKAD